MTASDPREIAAGLSVEQRMTDLEIGEYTACRHGPNGGRKFGCIPCAIEWHTGRQVHHAQIAENHLLMLQRLENEQITRNMAAADD